MLMTQKAIVAGLSNCTGNMQSGIAAPSTTSELLVFSTLLAAYGCLILGDPYLLSFKSFALHKKHISLHRHTNPEM